MSLRRLLFSFCVLLSSAGYGQKLPDLIPYAEEVEEDVFLWGYADTNLNITIKPQFISAGFFHNNRALVSVKTKSGYLRYGYIDKQGEFIIAPIFTKAGNFNNGYAKCFLNLSVYADYLNIDTVGNVFGGIVGADYELIGENKSYYSYHKVTYNNYSQLVEGLLNKQYEVVVPAYYKSVEPVIAKWFGGITFFVVSDGYNNNTGLINSELQTVIPLSSYKIIADDSFFVVWSGPDKRSYNFFNEDGNVIPPLKVAPKVGVGNYYRANDTLLVNGSTLVVTGATISPLNFLNVYNITTKQHGLYNQKLNKFISGTSQRLDIGIVDDTIAFARTGTGGKLYWLNGKTEDVGYSYPLRKLVTVNNRRSYYYRYNLDYGIIIEKEDYNEKYYLVNKKGEKLSAGYDDVGDLQITSEFVSVREGDNRGLINLSGQVIFKPGERQFFNIINNDYFITGEGRDEWDSKQKKLYNSNGKEVFYIGDGIVNEWGYSADGILPVTYLTPKRPKKFHSNSYTGDEIKEARFKFINYKGEVFFELTSQRFVNVIDYENYHREEGIKGIFIIGHEFYIDNKGNEYYKLLK